MVNTAAMYVRTVINVGIGFYVTRVILRALGSEDFGIYSLVAGVVSLLSFITAAMTSTTQRFLSYHQTHSNKEGLAKIFSNSLIIHVGLATISLIILELVGLVLFDGFLEIAPERVDAAKIVYQCAIFMTLCAFITAPYNALLISHENLVYASVVSVSDSVLKLCIAFTISFVVNLDQLEVYAFLMCGISVFNLLALMLYSIWQYDECKHPKTSHFSITHIKEMGCFAGWTLFGTACTLARTQGVAIIINRVWSTIANAAYGIAMQVNGAILFVGSSLLTAMNPQIVKAEGRGDRTLMLSLANTASKFCFLLLGSISVPMFIYMEQVLSIWLGEVPAYAVFFCQVMLVSNMADFMSYGLGTAVQAYGKLKVYSLMVFSIKLLTLPVLIILLKSGIEMTYAFWSYAVMEFLSSLARIYPLRSAGLKLWTFIDDVLLRELFSLSIYVVLNILIYIYIEVMVHKLLLIVVSMIVYAVVIYAIGLTKYETQIIKSIIHRLIPRKLID